MSDQGAGNTEDAGTGTQGSLDGGTEPSSDPQSFEASEHAALELLEDTTGAVPPPVTAPDAVIPTGESAGGVSLGDVVNLAKTAWDVMKDNAPVASATSDNANAVPAGATLTDLSGWDGTPRRLRLRYYRNSKAGDLLGTDLNSTEIFITCEWFFNGQYRGSGQYVDAATVVATGDVAVGNKINITASIANPFNASPPGASPVGALPVRIELQQSGVTWNLNSAWSGVVQGDGAGRLDPL